MGVKGGKIVKNVGVVGGKCYVQQRGKRVAEQSRPREMINPID